MGQREQESELTSIPGHHDRGFYFLYERYSIEVTLHMKILIANWKMNPTSKEQALELFRSTVSNASGLFNSEVVVCPPFVYLEECAKELALNNIPNLVLGAQDVFWQASGAYTGEVSAKMLREFYVQYVLIGHSDRRYTLGESDEMINNKIKAVLEEHMIPVLLVGEKEQDEAQEDTLIDQLSRDLKDLDRAQVSKIIFAYEPVWAISTSANAQVATSEHVLKSIALIKNILHKLYDFQEGEFPQMLYGGSVNKQNLKDFLGHKEIAGAVVGGASLKPEEFGAMMRIASELHD